MVLTHKKMASQKKQVIVPKEDNPARKFMSKAEAVEENRRLREDRIKVAQFEEKLRKERELKDADLQSVAQDVADAKQVVVPKVDNTAKIQELEEKIANEKGPGSKARKEKLQAKIDELKG